MSGLRAGVHGPVAVVPARAVPGLRHRGGLRLGVLVPPVEFSDTAVFDRPRDGRAWFDAAIRDHLDVGHPEKVALLFDRRVSATPGTFATKVITPGVDPHRSTTGPPRQGLLQGPPRRAGGDDDQQHRRLRCEEDGQRRELLVEDE